MSALKDLSGLLTTAVLLAVLFPVRRDCCLSLIPSRAINGAFVVLELVDVLSPAFLVRLLPFRVPMMLGAVFLSSVLGLLSSLALLFSCVFRIPIFGLLRRLSFGAAEADCVLPLIFLAIGDVFGMLIRAADLVLGFVTVAAERGFDVLILVATPEVFTELICLRGSDLVLLFTAGGVDFGLLIRVAICEVLGELVRAGDFGAGFDGFGALRATGDLAGRTDVVIREVFAGLIRFGGAGLVFAAAAGALAGRTDAAMREVFVGLTRLGGVGFGGFDVAGAGEGLEILRAGVVLRGGAEAFGGAGRLDRDERGLTFAGGGGLLRCGRAAALGAG